jgi:putative ABC transport system permease protein
MYLIVRTAVEPVQLVSSVRNAIKEIDPMLIIEDIETMDAIVSSTLMRPRLNVVLLSCFAALAVILAVVGIYGIVSYSVLQRTREIGVRTALGASQPTILKLILSQALVLASIGLGIGILSSLAVTRFLHTLLYQISPTDPITFVVVSLSLLGVAMLAAFVPARRAARLDPMTALRSD